jgi:hypothetical protein
MSTTAGIVGAETEATEADVMCCANCGIAGVDEIKLEECDGGCDLVKYCSDNCRENHREQHEEECKKRKAELHDRKVFTQPNETHLGECPICFLPLPLERSKSGFYPCCSEIVCSGCVYANRKSGGGNRCPFCREPVADDEEDFHKRLMKRIKANDPAAFRHMAGKCYNEGGYVGSFKYYAKAAELGDLDGHYHLGYMYHQGDGVEKDEVKAVYHWEMAAIGGHPVARHNLACIEWENNRVERAVKHLIIAANLGYENSMKELWGHYSHGNITKDDLDATLRSHQAALDEMKCAQRDKAERARKNEGFALFE